MDATSTDDGRLLWDPPADARATTRMGGFLDVAEKATGRSLADYHAAWDWSVEQPGEFWRTVWDYFDVQAHTPPTDDLADASMPGAVWFPGATFNYAELSWLILPRPFMVERGHHDTVAPDEWVAYEYARTRRRYDLLGLGDRTELEVFDGPHTIHGVGSFAFLRKHLSWPGKD